MFRKSPVSNLTTLDALDEALGSLRVNATFTAVVQRLRADVGALRFHRSDRGTSTPPLVVILGGTGTGKSTLVNRLLDANVTAASFRRTFTAGCVAVAEDALQVPPGWLGVEHHHLVGADLPARGQADRLLVTPPASRAGSGALPVLIDTPDLDGDTPAHHAQADRAFRWAMVVLFVVSPEKYQMTELLPYYRLAARYGVTSLFVMNKCESEAMRLDYTDLLQRTAPRDVSPTVHAIARDDAAYEPPVDANLDALRSALHTVRAAAGESRASGLASRSQDLTGRLSDQLVAPLRALRREIHRMMDALRALETPPPGVDVHPVTQQLRRRLQQRSVLYLIGPGKVLDRVRQVPGLLLRLPRYAWDLASKGKTTTPQGTDAAGTDGDGLPNFRALLGDQFNIVQSRIDDVLRATPTGERLLGQDTPGYTSSKLASDRAGAIADEELADLREWLEKRWNATPRDTAMLMKLLKYLPGGDKLTRWSEAAPYLLTIVVATHHAFFGHIDLILLGGYGLAAWLTERMSNEVASRTRQTNRTIQSRFERLTHEQIERTCAWLNAQAPTSDELDRLEKQMERMGE